MPSDAELEAIGRAEGKRLGVEPTLHKTAFGDDWEWTEIGEPFYLILNRYEIEQHDSDRAAYIALARAVLACREACGYAEAVAAGRERCAKVADECTIARPGWGTRKAIAAAIRRGTP